MQLTFAVALLAGSLAASPATASAGIYTVSPCSVGQPTPPQLTFFSTTTIFRALDECADGGALFVEGTSAPGSIIFGQHAEWVLQAPSFANIARLEMDEFFFGGPAEDGTPEPWEETTLAWLVRTNGAFLEGGGKLPGHRNNTKPTSGHLVYEPGINGVPQGLKEFTNVIECSDPNPVSRRCEQSLSGKIGAEVTNLTVDLIDSGAPVPSAEVGGSLLAQPDRAHGTKEVTFSGFDQETGIFSSVLLIDNQPIAEKRVDPSSNGGKCNPPFHTFIPCLPEASFAYSVDTTGFADGPHTLVAVVCDATETNCTGTQAHPFTVRNAPTNTAQPSIVGTAKPGSQLSAASGTWSQVDQLPFSFSYRWLRCPKTVTAPSQCTPIAGATNSRYTPNSNDVDKREIVEVTATLNVGQHPATAAFSAPSDVVSQDPAPPNGEGGENPPTGEGTPPRRPPNGVGHPPQTTLRKHPRKKTSRTRVKFAFSADQAGARFECKLDRGAFKPCHSPFKTKVKHGVHIFRVRAVNRAGEDDRTPALYRWKVL